jgi:hypothetical protein
MHCIAAYYYHQTCALRWESRRSHEATAVPFSAVSWCGFCLLRADWLMQVSRDQDRKSSIGILLQGQQTMPESLRRRHGARWCSSSEPWNAKSMPVCLDQMRLVVVKDVDFVCGSYAACPSLVCHWLVRSARSVGESLAVPHSVLSSVQRCLRRHAAAFRCLKQQSLE